MSSIKVVSGKVVSGKAVSGKVVSGAGASSPGLVILPEQGKEKSDWARELVRGLWIVATPIPIGRTYSLSIGLQSNVLRRFEAYLNDHAPAATNCLNHTILHLLVGADDFGLPSELGAAIAAELLEHIRRFKIPASSTVIVGALAGLGKIERAVAESFLREQLDQETSTEQSRRIVVTG